MRWFMIMALLTVSVRVSAEAGMIALDVDPGPVMGKGHWYTLRTMKGMEYWEDPAVLPDIRVVREQINFELGNEIEYYYVDGEVPVAVALVIHDNFATGRRDPWRKALNWLRESEQMFRNSGVPIRFLVNHIEVRDDLPDGKEAMLNHMKPEVIGYSDKYGVDMVFVLAPHYFGDPLCGIATVPSSNLSIPVSVSGCDPYTLSHEIGHNFGLAHSFDRSYPQFKVDYGRGHCISGEDSKVNKECARGTIMSYSYDQIPFFSNKEATLDGRPLGDDKADAVGFLNRFKTNRALSHELRQQSRIANEPEDIIVFD